MDAKEKLVELLGANTCKCDYCEDCEYCKDEDACIAYLKNSMADYLIAHGVTVQELGECDYCKQFDDPWDAPMIAKEDYEPDRGIYLYNGFLCANGGEFVDAKVNFCPMCGRRLPPPPKGE